MKTKITLQKARQIQSGLNHGVPMIINFSYVKIYVLFLIALHMNQTIHLYGKSYYGYPTVPERLPYCVSTGFAKTF